MEKIELDMGLRAYRVGEGVLRFHPGDPNVYARFSQASGKLEELEAELRQSQQDPVEALEQADRRLKDLLGWIFGPGNDFDAICGGVSLLAVGENGKTLAQSLLDALEPVLLEGAEGYAKALAEQRLAHD